MATKIDGNQIVLKNSSIAPSPPATGNSLIYANSSSNWYQIDFTGGSEALQSNLRILGKNGLTGVLSITGAAFPQSHVSMDSNRLLTMFPYPIPTIRMFLYADALILSSGATIYPTGGVLKITANTAVFGNSGSLQSGNTTKFGTSTTTNVPNGVDNSTVSNTSDPRNVWLSSSCAAMYYVKICTDVDISNQAIFIGLVSSTISADDIGSTQGVYFRYSTSASDTNWQGVVHASSANRTVQDLGVAVTTSTTYDLLFYMASDSVRFYVNGTYIASVSYPTGFGSVAACPQVTIQTKEAVAKYLHVYTIYYESAA